LLLEYTLREFAENCQRYVAAIMPVALSNEREGRTSNLRIDTLADSNKQDPPLDPSTFVATNSATYMWRARFTSVCFVMLQYQILKQNSKTKLGQLTHPNLQLMPNYPPAAPIIPHWWVIPRRSTGLGVVPSFAGFLYIYGER